MIKEGCYMLAVTLLIGLAVVFVAGMIAVLPTVILYFLKLLLIGA